MPAKNLSNAQNAKARVTDILKAVEVNEPKVEFCAICGSSDLAPTSDATITVVAFTFFLAPNFCFWASEPRTVVGVAATLDELGSSFKTTRFLLGGSCSESNTAMAAVTLFLAALVIRTQFS